MSEQDSNSIAGLMEQMKAGADEIERSRKFRQKDYPEEESRESIARRENEVMDKDNRKDCR